MTDQDTHYKSTAYAENKFTVSTAPGKPTRCPNSIEIQNAETSASSNTLGDAERAERWRQIGEMKRCGK